MLDYEWGNPSSIMLTGDEVSGSETSREMFEHNNSTVLSNNIIHGPTPTTTNGFCLHNHFNPPPQHYPFFDSRAFEGASTTSLVNQSPSMLSVNPIPALAHGPRHGLMFMSKSKHLTMSMNLNSDYKLRLEHEPKLDLNFKGQTYFPSSSNEDYRVYHFKMVDSSNLPRCQVEGCRADLSEAKHYHRRHKVCEFHSKAATVIAAGLTQRFCQQCSRFHLLSEFDNGKRSCRKRLADHNRRRRKTQQQAAQEIHKDNVARSSPECGAQSSQSLKVAVSWK